MILYEGLSRELWASQVEEARLDPAQPSPVSRVV